MVVKAFQSRFLDTVAGLSQYEFTATALNLRKPSYFCRDFHQHTFFLFTGYFSGKFYVQIFSKYTFFVARKVQIFTRVLQIKSISFSFNGYEIQISLLQFL